MIHTDETDERRRVAELVGKMKIETERRLRATDAMIKFTRPPLGSDVYEVSCFIEGRPFSFIWQPEPWKEMPSDFDWDGLLLEARPIR